MIGFFSSKISRYKQYSISVLLVLLVSGLCYALTPYIGYRVIAFILLLTVSLIAISFDIWPVLLSAVLSAFTWNFFFIPPRFTLHVRETEDVILFAMYFVIALMNAALTYKIRQIEKASRKKEEKANLVKLYDTMLNSLSHELRTPISTIIAATDNLQSHNTQLTNENKELLVSEIAKASFRLNQQVENLLNMSRLESGFIKPRMNWCDAGEIIHAAVQKVEERKLRQRIIINIKPNMPLVRTDNVMLEQIIYNLLTNACLYTKEDSTINISATNHTDMLELVIEDDGEGFPEDEIAYVFDKFYRLRSAKTGGTGLGLSIVKGFTEALKGSVELKNVSTGGAKFTVNIPCEITYLEV